MKYEYCCKCDCATGKAGAGDDSLYTETDGPFCENCFPEFKSKQEQDEPLEYWNAVEGWVKLDEVREHFDSVSCATIYKNGGEGRVPLCLAQPKQEQETPFKNTKEKIMINQVLLCALKEYVNSDLGDVELNPRKRMAIEAIAEAEKQEGDEPVAMRYDFDGYGYKYIDSGSGSDWQTREKGAEPLYTTPQQRKPLTSEQIDEIYFDSTLDIDRQYNQLYAFARAIEAAHGIKE